MAKYKFKATDASGKKVSGIMEAATEEALYEKLRQQNLYVLSFALGGAKGNKKKIPTQVLAEFSRQIGTLLKAGVSLVRALGIISGDELTKKKYKSIYNEVLTSVRQGTTLSDAMEDQGEAFPPLIINMYRSAEASGELDKVALRMAIHYEKESRMKTKMKNAMIYPCILGVLIVAVVMILFVFVIPQFKELFDTMGELPWITRLMMGISSVVQRFWWVIILGTALLIYLIRILFKVPEVKYQKDKLKLHLPLFGKLLKVVYTARFARTLSSLYSAGLPITMSLPIASTTIGNAYIEGQFESVIAKVRGGANLSTSLAEINGFIGKLISSIMVGEETGSLDSMLDSIANDLDYESEMAIGRMMTFIEPVMIIIMAIIVGAIIISVMLPLMGSYDAIGSMGM